MPLPPEFLEELRIRLPLAAYVGRWVKLTRRGREHIGLCPFHNEKTPSFSVNEEKGFFHCFGCAAHGDVIGFAMRREGLSFPEAIERLANEAGLQLPKTSPQDRAVAQRRAEARDAVEAAAAWFQAQLSGKSGSEARRYLEGRGLTADTVEAFGLGFAPSRRGEFRAALNAKGLDDRLLAEAGLIKVLDDGTPPRDYFFNRVIFPIQDRRGRPIAFGGRALGDSRAKYLNSPESPLFRKGEVLYNLSRARQAAYDSGELLVCEGYMDVIALFQAGFAAAVAPLGTALTEAQLGLLWRLVPEPIVCLDGDAAGRSAAYRLIDRALPLLRAGHSLKFCLLPQGEDPDSFVQAQGAVVFRRLLDQALPLVDLLWEKECQKKRFDTPESKAGLKRALRDSVDRIRDSDVREAYSVETRRRFDEAFGFQRTTRTAMRSKWRGRSLQGGSPSTVAPGRLGTGVGVRQPFEILRKRGEQVMLALVINHPALLDEFAEALGNLILGMPALDRMRRAILDIFAEKQDLDSAALRCHLTEQGFVEILNDALSPALYAHCPAAQPNQPTEVARGYLLECLMKYRNEQAKFEAKKQADILGQTMNEEDLLRLQATQTLYSEEESKTEVGDPSGPAQTGLSKRDGLSE